jgi:hypothetical protein
MVVPSNSSVPSKSAVPSVGTTVTWIHVASPMVVPLKTPSKSSPSEEPPDWYPALSMGNCLSSWTCRPASQFLAPSQQGITPGSPQEGRPIQHSGTARHAPVFRTWKFVVIVFWESEIVPGGIGIMLHPFLLEMASRI